MRTRVASISRALVVATLALALAAQPALASSKSGDTTCTALKRVWIYSTASVDVYHNWKLGHYTYWYNPYRVYHENNTGYSSTWWVIDYDFEITGWGAYCASI